jgi:transcriptional regulator with XRE-family HTH domain
MRAKKDAEKAPSLTEERLKQYALFRHNLRLLRATTGLSAEALGKQLGLSKYHRVIDLEGGRTSQPKLDEVKIIAEFFKITIDELLYKKAVISFEKL